MLIVDVLNLWFLYHTPYTLNAESSANISNLNKSKHLIDSLIRHDLRSSITVFFVALPLCLGISLASNAPVFSGLIAGVIGGILVTLISKSGLSVSGPAAGLATICAATILELGSLEYFFMSVAMAGVIQIILGIFRLGGFTHFIPSAVIKGMLAAIGILLISKQIPLIIGYAKPDFWSNQLFNIITFDHGFMHLADLYQTSSAGVFITAVCSMLLMFGWNKYLSKKISFLPGSFIAVAIGILLAMGINLFLPVIKLQPNHFIQVPNDILSYIHLPDFSLLMRMDHTNSLIWKNAILIGFVASLETLLSIAAIDKLDPYNRITPNNRELIAQGAGNIVSGLLGGIPITAVIIRGSANAEAGAKTKMSAFLHGLWLLLAILVAIPLINKIPYCILAIILVRTGYNLAKPSMIMDVYRQGREQFFPFIFTVVAILFTDLLIGVLIGLIYAIYFLFKHTYQAGFQVKEINVGHHQKYIFDLDQNVNFLNKRRLSEALDKIPEYSEVEINGLESQYIDQDILEIIQDYRSKAHLRHVQFSTLGIKSVKTIELH